MSKERPWLREVHDAVLAQHHARGLTDYEISDRFIELDMPFSFDTIRYARQRLKLKPNRAKQVNWEQRCKPPSEKANPLASARLYLGKRLVEKDTGFWLDGLPASLTTVMRGCNRARIAAGVNQIDYNPAWLV